jgi:hypothetical protein
VAERLKAPVSKTGKRWYRFAGSNPAPSAISPPELAIKNQQLTIQAAEIDAASKK